MRGHQGRARQQLQHLAGTGLDLLLTLALRRIEQGQAGLVALSGRIDRLHLPGIHRAAETRAARQQRQISQLQAGAEDPEAGADKGAQQAERRQAEPVRRQRHAQRAGIEGRPEVAPGAHGCGFS
ncbi:hypothetical protein D3C84_927400 [compost metagenome]